MDVRGLFEVLYSPVKAFKKIIEKPDFKGVLLILVLVIFSMVAVEYVAASKFLLETRMPDGDDWTESLLNQHNWTSNGSPSLDDTDYKMGNTVGNHSVKSLVSSDTSIWMKITDIEPLDCSEDTGYKELFFWIKWIHENGSFPDSGATLRLFSGSESSYFERSLTNFIASSDEWSNATLKVGPDQGWSSTNSSDWKSVTGLEFRLFWLDSTNPTMKIDGLYFRKYVSPLETGAFSGAIIPILMSAAVSFSMNWILWAGILLMVAKVFREEVGPWTVFFVIIGHVFIVTGVYMIVSAVSLSTLPVLNLPLADGSYISSHEILYPYLAYQVWLYLPLVGEVWIAVLCATAIRLLRGITWGKAASISVVAFIIRLILRFFFGV
ncbi:MAG: hypothetical protein OEY90_02835 [Candidatus Bathyarchaeota archaeon]|nr:hypothetical protein [Candidatus Bathyarchaeota archaeon]